MTRDEIMAMDGPELVVKVAEKVMGWKWDTHNPRQSLLLLPDGVIGAVIFHDGTADDDGIGQVLECPDYPTDIAAAWQVHTFLLSQGPQMKALYLHALADVLIDKYPGPPSVWTAPIECFDEDTICRAALLATMEAES